LEGEAMTIKKVIEEIMQRDLSHFIFESDSKVVVDLFILGKMDYPNLVF
jgi:hypothetical protein